MPEWIYHDKPGRTRAFDLDEVVTLIRFYRSERRTFAFIASELDRRGIRYRGYRGNTRWCQRTVMRIAANLGLTTRYLGHSYSRDRVVTIIKFYRDQGRSFPFISSELDRLEPHSGHMGETNWTRSYIARIAAEAGMTTRRLDRVKGGTRVTKTLYDAPWLPWNKRTGHYPLSSG